jgi:hypothetical protein
MTAQPITALTSGGVDSGTFTTYCSSTSVWSAQVKTSRAIASVPSPSVSSVGQGGRLALEGGRGSQVTTIRSPSAT